MSYREKYLKYKHKYITLKKSLNESKNCVHNFYFIHSTFNFQNLMSILKSSILRPGKYLPLGIEGLSGSDTGHKNVFMNIYFEDIKNIESTRTFTLILHPKIIFDNGFIFSKGWGMSRDIIITSTESPVELNSRLNQIRDFLIDPTSLSDTIINFHGSYHHEVTFDHAISLSNGNLIGIICGDKSVDL